MDLNVGDVIDALDTYDKWYESTVVDKKFENSTYTWSAQIHFNGWSNKYREWLPTHSQRLAKKGKWTSGPYISSYKFIYIQ